MSRKTDCYDSALTESFLHNLKTEVVRIAITTNAPKPAATSLFLSRAFMIDLPPFRDRIITPVQMDVKVD
jgi:hypothetical protein